MKIAEIKTNLLKHPIFILVIISMISGFGVAAQYYMLSIFFVPVIYVVLCRWTFEKPESPFATKTTIAYLVCLLAYFFATARFLIPAIREFGRLPLPFAFIVSFIFTMFNSFPYWLVLTTRDLRTMRRPYWVCWAIGSCLLAAYWPNIGSILPGEALAQYDWFQPTIRMFGTQLVSFLTFLFSLIFAEAIVVRKNKFALGTIVTYLFVLVISYFLDLQVNPRQQVNSDLKIALVQSTNPTGSLDVINAGERNPVVFAHKFLEKLAIDLKENPTNLVAVPESAIESFFGFPWDEKVKSRIQRGALIGMDHFLSEHGTYLLADSVENALTEDGGISVSSIPMASLYSRYSAQLIDFTPKTYLTPFMEYVPGGKRWPWLRPIFPWARTYPSEIPARNFQIENLRFRPMICYDSLFAESYRQALHSGAEFGISLTNNYYLKSGSHFQAAIARARSIESGLPLLYVGSYADTGAIGIFESPRLADGKFGIIHVNAGDLIKVQTLFSRYSTTLVGNILDLAGYFAIVIGFLGFFIVLVRTILCHKSAMKKIFVTYVLPTGFALGIYVVTTTLIIQVIFVPTPSMFPAIQPGERVLVCRFKHDYQRGDIVSGKVKIDDDAVIKRLILLPGDHLFKGGRIVDANGKEWTLTVTENNGVCTERLGDREWVIPCSAKETLTRIDNLKMTDNEVFLMGDNRIESEDSRFSGPGQLSWLNGKLCREKD